MNTAAKYFNERLCRGGDCTAKSQMFIYNEAAKVVVELFNNEQLNKLSNSIKNMKGINGIKGLIAKNDVLGIINNYKKEKFKP